MRKYEMRIAIYALIILAAGCTARAPEGPVNHPLWIVQAVETNKTSLTIAGLAAPGEGVAASFLNRTIKNGKYGFYFADMTCLLTIDGSGAESSTLFFGDENLSFLTNSIAAYQGGDLIIGGAATSTEGERRFTPLPIVTLVDSSGGRRWLVYLDLKFHKVEVYKVAEGEGGEILAAGRYYRSFPDGRVHEGLFAARLSPSGEKLGWMELEGNYYPTGVAPGMNGEVFVSGYFFPVSDNPFGVFNSKGLLVRFAADGTIAQTDVYDTAGKDIRFSAIVSDRHGGLYLTGITSGEIAGKKARGVRDAIVARVGSDSSIVWLELLGGITKNTDGSAMAVHPSGRVFAAGHTDANLNGQIRSGENMLYIVEYTADGARLQTRLIGDPELYFTSEAMAIGRDGAVYLVGDTSRYNYGEPVQGGGKLVIMKYDVSGLCDGKTQPCGSTDSLVTGGAVSFTLPIYGDGGMKF